MVNFRPQKQALKCHCSRHGTLDHVMGLRDPKDKEVENVVSKSHRISRRDVSSFLCLSSCVERPLVTMQQFCG